MAKALWTDFEAIEDTGGQGAEVTTGRTASKLVKAKVAIHDRTQLEAVFDYRFLEKKWQNRAEKRSYRVDAYLFFPPQMAITPQVYPKDHFYQDLRALIRLREPSLSYKELLGIPPLSDRSPICFLKGFLHEKIAGASPEDFQTAIDEGRIFACAYMSYFLRRIRRRKTKLENLVRASIANDHLDFERLLETVNDVGDFLQKGYQVLEEWRQLVAKAQDVTTNDAVKLHKEFRLADEYCSYVFRDGLALMLNSLACSEGILDKNLLASLRQQLLSYVGRERTYFEAHRFMWIEKDSSRQDQERYVYRRGALKRHIWRVLYLDVRTQPLFSVQRQFAAMFAAGMAAFWAILAEILIRTHPAFRNMSGFNISSLGFSGFLIITAFIMAYILKDRIKELGKSYLSSSILRSVPDNSNRIFYRSDRGKQFTIGTIREYTRFLSTAKLAPSLLSLRRFHNQEQIEEEERYESVLHYSKLVELNADELIKQHHQPIVAVHDILRLNVQAFLPRLDDPLHDSLVIAPDGDVQSIMMPKVYHLDMILRYARDERQENSQHEVFDYIRLVLDKQGLARIERLT